MKPGDHPDFFRLPAPEGRSRESTIRLDREGRFWHDGARVAHAGLAQALHSWIRKHPDNGRYILTNGYDWTYFAVDETPYFVRALRGEPREVFLILSDGTEEAWRPETTSVATDGALVAAVKRDALGGPYEAKFTRHAQSSLAPWLVEGKTPESVGVRVGGQVHAIGAKRRMFG